MMNNKVKAGMEVYWRLNQAYEAFHDEEGHAEFDFWPVEPYLIDSMEQIKKVIGKILVNEGEEFCGFCGLPFAGVQHGDCNSQLFSSVYNNLYGK